MFLDETPIVLTGNFEPPAMGSDGKDFLIAWIGYKIINIARVSGDGKVLDTPAIEFRQPGGLHVYHPALAYGGGNYLLVWEEATLGQTSADERHHGRPGGSGNRQDGGAGHQRNHAAHRRRRPGVAFDGTNFLVVWEDHRDAMPAVYGNRVRPSDGALLDGANGFRVGNSASGQAPAVAFGGGEYLVAFQAGTSLAGARPTRPITARPIPRSSRWPRAPRARRWIRRGWPGTDRTSCWPGARRTCPSSISPRASIPTPARCSNPATSRSATPGTTPRIQRVQTSRRAVGASWPSSAPSATAPRPTSSTTPRGRRSTPASGALARPVFGFPQTADWQQYPDCSSDGSHHLVVWQERAGAHFEVRGARVSNADGTLNEPDSFTISSGAADQVYPRTASNGSNHLVVWCDGTSLRAGRVKGSDGSLLDGAGIALPGKSGAPSSGRPFYGVASDGTDYLVLWTEEGADPVRLRAARVRGSDGMLLDTTAISVAADGSRRLFPGWPSRDRATWRPGWTMRATSCRRCGSPQMGRCSTARRSGSASTPTPPRSTSPATARTCWWR